ncbi:MAG: hypothetical protein KTR19_12765, partial [Hyphomicrobiales bacterium]|nr:hypothetical protein [Hyphomicrobiales bacterium]
VARAEPSERIFRKLAANSKIGLLQSWPEFCEEATCNAMRDGRALYFDNNHVTNQTALSIRHIFEPLVTGIGRPVMKSEAAR